MDKDIANGLKMGMQAAATSYAQTLHKIQAKYEVTNNFRQFKPANMTDIKNV